ncbi:unnamed protein product [Larinioides sclopetarius]|uniref:DNA (cytosine-5-)-methyltransferase n=1 Tax=Larinioides sclopetarius TaxID=280406 RepID=A0AAV1ZX77_9ARAC
MFKRGDIVWGKIKTYPWWPAIVLNPKDCGRDKVGRNKFWIFWFGDHKITQVKCNEVLDFQKHFEEKCVPKIGKALKSAICEVLTILAARYNIKNSDPSSLFDWARKGFKKKLCRPSDNSKSLELPDIVKNALKKKAFQRKEDNDDEIVNALDDVSKGKTSLEDICVMCFKLDNSVVMPHPFFVGGVCQDCRPFISEITKTPKGQMNDICILCCQGGNLVYCCNSFCMSAYCETCIDYMTPKETLSEILKDNDWKCYLCMPATDDRCLIKRREVYLAVGPSTRPVKKSSICVMGLNDAGQECLFVSFYKFLYRLVMTRPLKPYIFFMYMCDAEIVNEFIKMRVRRFLQVDPTKIKIGKKEVYLWSNLPAIKDIKDNVYLMKKSRGPMFIEEDILNKFLEPLKDFFHARIIK